MRLGLTKEAPQRLRAGISYALQTATDEGHCALPVEELVCLSVTLLDVGEAPIRNAIEGELAGGDVILDRIEDEPCLFLRGLHGAERDIADRLSALARGTPPWPQIDAELAAPWVEARTGKILSASQREAIALVLHSKVAVVTGGPAVGKTMLLDTILRILIANGVRIRPAAPTARAAKRMSDQTGIEAKTIHRLLEIHPKNGGFRKGVADPFECDLLVLDETSMIDVPLMNAITKAVPKRAGLLLVGFVDQLPSVGPGRVLADVIDSGAVTVARLTKCSCRLPTVTASRQDPQPLRDRWSSVSGSGPRLFRRCPWSRAHSPSSRTLPPPAGHVQPAPLLSVCRLASSPDSFPGQTAACRRVPGRHP